MRLKARDIKKALYICTVLAFLVSIHVASIYIFAVHRFTITVDPVLSKEAEQAIYSFIQDADLHRAKKSDNLVRLLKEAFPFVRSLTCCYKPGFLHVDVKAYRPLFQLNNDQQDMIVTEHNRCIPAAYFEPYVYEHKPRIVCKLEHGKDRLPNTIFAYLASIDQSLLLQSNVEWRHHNEIVIDMADVPIRFLCDRKHTVSQAFLDHCKAILDEHAQTPLYKSGMHADIRFDDRIIVSKLKR